MGTDLVMCAFSRREGQRPSSNLAGTAQEGPPFSSKPMPGVQHTNSVFPKPKDMEGCLKVYILYHRPLTLYVGKTYLCSSRSSINRVKKLSVGSSLQTSEMRPAILMGITNETHTEKKLNIKQRNTVGRIEQIQLFWRAFWQQLLKLIRQFHFAKFILCVYSLTCVQG